jgi:two-component system, OmpR family, osmolarity sensor histidine kinase EnvZ
VYAVLSMGSVMLYKALTNPSVYNPNVQISFFVLTSITIATISTFNFTLSVIRFRIEQQKNHLANAMHRFQASGEVPPTQEAALNKAKDPLWLQFAELAQQRRDLEERRSIMLAAISHDLRSPLGRIRMAAELLPESQGVAVRRESIARNVAVANRLLTNFIDMARVDHEPIDGRVDLRELVLDAADEWPELQIKSLPEQAQWLEPASAVGLERVLRNLIDNAQAHGAAPLEMGLTVDAQPMLWLRDHGPGVDPALYEHFLQPFTRAEVNRMKPGTGLGLAIVQRTMVRHGGRVVLVNAQPGLRVELYFSNCQMEQG